MPEICGECGQLKPPKDHNRGAIILVPKWLTKAEVLEIMDLPAESEITWHNDKTPEIVTSVKAVVRCINPDHDPADCKVELPAWGDHTEIEIMSWDFYLEQYKPTKFDSARARTSVGLT